MRWQNLSQIVADWLGTADDETHLFTAQHRKGGDHPQFPLRCPVAVSFEVALGQIRADARCIWAHG